MPFGESLLNQQAEIEAYGDNGNLGIAKLVDYIRKRAAVEEEYTRALIKLNKIFSPAGIDDLGLADILCFVDKSVLARQEFAFKLKVQVVESLIQTAKIHVSERKHVLRDIKNLRSQWSKMVSSFEKIRKARDTAIQKADEAKTAFDRANYDRNVTKAHVERLRDEYTALGRKALLCKEEFIQATALIRELRDKMYGTDLPNAFNKLQKVEENRIEGTKQSLNTFATGFRYATDLEQDQMSNLAEQWSQLQSNTIVELFVESIRSEKPFEYPEGDLLREKEGDEERMRRKSSLLLASCDPLPIRTRIAELKAEERILIKEKDGLQVLIKLYTSNPDLSDRDALEKVLSQHSQISKLLELNVNETKALITKMSTLASGNDIKGQNEDKNDYQILNSAQANTKSQNIPLGNVLEKFRDRTSSESLDKSPNLLDLDEDIEIIPDCLDPEEQIDLKSLNLNSQTELIDTPTSDQNDDKMQNTSLLPLKNDENYLINREIGKNPTNLPAIPLTSPHDSVTDKSSQLKDTPLRIPFIAEVLYNFEARIGSEGDELSVKAKEIVTVVSCEEDWWKVIRSTDGSIGYVPHNYVKRIAT